MTEPRQLFITDTADPAAPLLREAWQRSPDFDELFAIVRSRRPAAVAPFCAVSVDADGLRVAIHGGLGLTAVVNGKRIELRGHDADSRIEETIVGDISALTLGDGALQLVWPQPDVPPATVIGAVPAEAVQAQAPFDHRATLAVASAAVDLKPIEVEGVLCSTGHFNDPETAVCRICGAPNGEQLIRRPRPALGRLLTQDGREFVVDRPLVIGRKPELAGEVVEGAAEPVDVPSAETGVSRVHAELLIEGWSVLVRDLGSSNGTYVLPAGLSEWFRLEPNHPIEIEHGSLIAVGEFELKFEPPSS